MSTSVNNCFGVVIGIVGFDVITDMRPYYGIDFGQADDAIWSLVPFPPIILAIIRAMIRGSWRIREYLALIGALALIYLTISSAIDADKGWWVFGVVLVVLFIAARMNWNEKKEERSNPFYRKLINSLTGPYL